MGPMPVLNEKLFGDLGHNSIKLRAWMDKVKTGRAAFVRETGEDIEKRDLGKK